MNPFENARRYVRTLRYLTFRQTGWRAWYILRRTLRLYPRPGAPATSVRLSPSVRIALRAHAAAWAAVWPEIHEAAQALRRREITFCGHTEASPGSLPWHKAGLPRLWRYRLHGFDHLLPLVLHNAIAPNAEDRLLAQTWMMDWIAHNPIGTDVAWDAYPTAQRLMHWSLALAVFDQPQDALLDSLWRQTRYLARSLEYDLRANHLLQNALGLLIAGKMLDDPLWKTGARVVEQELREQLLPDGGHFERSPMYHCHILTGLLLAHAAFPEKPVAWNDTVARMAAYLAAILHGDGDIPLFGDAALGETLPPKRLIALACSRTSQPVPPAPRGCYALESSGFYVLGPADGAQRMIVKAGPAGPAYQLGHAHCDMLSYEFSAGAARLIVDSGVHGYAESPWRAYCRSTRAHNTVSVNGQEQMECWSAFRVGRRYTATRHAWGKHPLGWVLCASHDGFGPFCHRRGVLYSREGFWLIVDEVRGPGRCRAESFVHFHPSVHLLKQAGEWRMGHNSLRFSIIPFGAHDMAEARGEHAHQQGWYAPCFGSIEPASSLVMRAEGESCILFGYAIVSGTCPIPPATTLRHYGEAIMARGVPLRET